MGVMKHIFPLLVLVLVLVSASGADVPTFSDKDVGASSSSPRPVRRDPILSAADQADKIEAGYAEACQAVEALKEKAAAMQTAADEAHAAAQAKLVPSLALPTFPVVKLTVDPRASEVERARQTERWNAFAVVWNKRKADKVFPHYLAAELFSSTDPDPSGRHRETMISLYRALTASDSETADR